MDVRGINPFSLRVLDVWDVPPDRFTVDNRLARSFGLSPGQCREGLPLESVTLSVHPEDVLRFEQAIAETIRRGGAYLTCPKRQSHLQSELNHSA